MVLQRSVRIARAPRGAPGKRRSSLGRVQRISVPETRGVRTSTGRQGSKLKPVITPKGEWYDATVYPLVDAVAGVRIA
jgi:hypothetical protein